MTESFEATEWLSTLNDPPDWEDGGLIELRRNDGPIIKAWLAFDCYFNGEDEVPVPDLDIDQSFYDFVEWRPVAHK
jgi:hypothetical protein